MCGNGGRRVRRRRKVDCVFVFVFVFVFLFAFAFAFACVCWRGKCETVRVPNFLFFLFFGLLFKF